MKMPVRILLIFLCAALIIALPFAVSSPNMLNNVKMELMNGEDDEDEIDFQKSIWAKQRVVCENCGASLVANLGQL